MQSAHSTLFQTSDFIAYSTIAGSAILEYFIPSTLAIERVREYVFGVVLLLISWSIILIAKYHFKKFKQPSSPGRATTQMVTSGIFSYSRNPMYVGVVLLVIAIGFIFDSAWIAGSTIAVWFLIQSVLIRPEEKYLERLFGEDYRAYMMRVRRWL